MSSARSVEGSAPGSLRPGGWLNAGSVLLEKRILELEFANGARLLLEGPGELQLVESDHAILKFGRTAAEDPDRARGFVLEVPGAQVVDLGTTFAVNARQGGDVDVHVFSGEVETPTMDNPSGKLEVIRMKSADTFRVSPSSR